MSMRAIFVFGSALVMSATITAQARPTSPGATAQKPQPAPRAPSVKPAQPQQGARGGVPRDFNRLGLDFTVFGTPLEGRVVKGMPYSAEIAIESVQTLGDGNRIVHRSTSRVYRDTEGRVRREDDRPTGSPSITITDPVANKSYTLDSAARTAREMTGLRLLNGYFLGLESATYRYALADLPMTTGAGGARGGRGGSASATSSTSGTQGNTTVTVGRGGRGGRARDGRDEQVEEQLPNRTIEGVVASGIRRTTTIPAGAIGNEQPIKIVSEEWTSVDLQVLVLTDLNDPRTGRSTYKLSNINRRNPDPALFKVPADYTLQPAGGRGRGGSK